jgi:hypothetical protein
MEEIEIWKPVPNYEGYYEGSTLGQIRSLNYRKTKGRIQTLLLTLDKDGYQKIELRKPGANKTAKVGRIIAETWLEKPSDPLKNEINHKNGIRSDNRVVNLEWVTHSENIRHSYNELGRTGSNKGNFGKLSKCAIAVNQYDLEGNFIKEWGSIADIVRYLNISGGSCISQVCKGRARQAHGFIWRYKE